MSRLDDPGMFEVISDVRFYTNHGLWIIARMMYFTLSRGGILIHLTAIEICRRRAFLQPKWGCAEVTCGSMAASQGFGGLLLVGPSRHHLTVVHVCFIQDYLCENPPLPKKYLRVVNLPQSSSSFSPGPTSIWGWLTTLLLLAL